MSIVSTLLVLISYFFPKFGLVAAAAFVATMIPVTGTPGHGSVSIGFYFSWFMGVAAFFLASYRIIRGRR